MTMSEIAMTGGAQTAPCAELDARVRYAAAVLLDCPLDDFHWPEWLAYGPPARGHRGITIVPSGFFGPAYGTPGTLPALPLATLDDIPILFGKPLLERRAEELIVHADILASAFFLLTRYEEWVRPDARDQHDRFPGTESLLSRAGFLERPVVDEYAEKLRQWAAQRGLPWPGRKRTFTVLLTHDIDTLGPELGVESALRQIAAAGLGRKPWNEAVAGARSACGWTNDRHNNLSEVRLLDRVLQERLGPDCCRVIYFFMAGGNSVHDRPYRLRAPLARQAVRQVLAGGAEVGLHASYSAGMDPGRIAGERTQLEAVAQVPVTKNRHHFLNWREMHQGRALVAGGIQWDSTLGFADLAGFRLGVCRPVPLFDPAARTAIGLEEHPLIVMDCSLSFPKYMNLEADQAFACVRRLADATRRHHGEFVLNWHNTSLSAAAPGYDRSLYVRILDYLARSPVSGFPLL
jgi:hypothetical protein